MRRLSLVLLFTTTIIITGFAQVGIGTTTPNQSSVLDLTSTTQAFIPPRMNTTQQSNISNPVMGMTIYNTDSNCIVVYRGSAWFSICNVTQPLYSGSVIAYAPVTVSKTATQRVFAHLMPWFETPTTNGGNWGIHWKMATQDPNNIKPNGQRSIASNYYPLTGPYASSDTAIIDYQLLLLKLSGFDGVFIDWPGTGTNGGLSGDLPLNERNTKAFVARIAKAGLSFALVYEDNFLGNVSNKIAQGQADMTYAQTNYFSNANYEKIGNAPLLLVFGPQVIKTAADWTSIFSPLTTKPAFLSYMSNTFAGAAATGQFGWVEQTGTTRLASFYSTNPGTKITAAYPGFNSFYTAGGWSGPTWTITVGTSTLQSSLTQALQQSDSHYLQVATWNDYGEGTMIEPTDSTTGGFGYSLLTTVQQNLGVSTFTKSDLAAVLQLYKLRQTYVGNATALNKLTQVYYYMVSLQMDKAKALLATL